jgi:hypothetical protein
MKIDRFSEKAVFEKGWQIKIEFLNISKLNQN